MSVAFSMKSARASTDARPMSGGKNQLAAGAAAQHGREVRDHLAELGAAAPKDVAAAFLEFARPVAQLPRRAPDAPSPPWPFPQTRRTASRAAAATFAFWTEQLERNLRQAGLAATDAEEKAALLVALLQGAQVLCRASGSTEAFERAARAALTLFAGP
ncbi:hypothetical protein ACIQ6R_35365 [Streptomyces sp. NPDC096048]|uniref:LmrA/YxaF family transcription factor n=1 Tax=Streptomyces sp. NPDC096048 TaxID=3366072 RepID=UPI0038011C23